jgi:hypothetical protein
MPTSPTSLVGQFQPSFKHNLHCSGTARVDGKYLEIISQHATSAKETINVYVSHVSYGTPFHHLY